MGVLSLAGLSPYMIAIDLVGEDFYRWMLGDGANVCPGASLVSFQAIMEAAEEFALGRGRMKT